MHMLSCIDCQFQKEENTNEKVSCTDSCPVHGVRTVRLRQHCGSSRGSCRRRYRGSRCRRRLLCIGGDRRCNDAISKHRPTDSNRGSQMFVFFSVVHLFYLLKLILYIAQDTTGNIKRAPHSRSPSSAARLPGANTIPCFTSRHFAWSCYCKNCW